MAKRRQFSTQFKAREALEAMRGELTMAELAKKYDVHPSMVAGWKRRLVEEAVATTY